MSASRAFRQLRLQRTANNVRNTVSLTTPTTLGNTYKLVLPTAVPSAGGQALISDTSGNLSWGSFAAVATQSSFSAANNVTTAANVTGLSITASPTVIPIYIQVNATSSYFAITTIRVYYNTAASAYVLESNSAGDNTGVRFDVTSAGQVVYYSGNYAGFSSLTFTWFAPYTPVSSATTSLSLTNSLSVGTNTTLGGTAISGTPSATSGGLFFLQGTTFTDSSTAASGTAASFNAAYLAAPTLAAANTSVTTTAASTLTIAAPPVAGTNQTFTNAFSLNIVKGNSYTNGLSFSGLAQQYFAVWFLNTSPSVANGTATAASTTNSNWTLIPGLSSANASSLLSGGNFVASVKGQWDLFFSTAVSSTTMTDLEVWFIVVTASGQYMPRMGWMRTNYSAAITNPALHTMISIPLNVGDTVTPVIFQNNTGSSAVSVVTGNGSGSSGLLSSVSTIFGASLKQPLI